MAEIKGNVQTIVYRNEENGWTVMEICDASGDLIMAVGAMPVCGVGEDVVLEGNYTTHPRYGRQFKVTSCRVLAPATLSAVEGYLASGLIRGIGPSTAKLIVKHFGMDTLDVMDTEPERLMEIPGIGPKKCAMITLSFRENRMMRDVLLALEPYGITVNQAYKLYHIYGPDCVARIEEDPYQMIQDVDGIGFVTADRIAQRVEGFSADSPARLKAGLLYAMNKAANEYGHTNLPRTSLLNFTTDLLHADEELLTDALGELVASHQIIYQVLGEQDCYFLPAMHRMESEIANRLIRLSAPPRENPFLEAAAARSRGGITLSHEQAEAVRMALRSGVLVITGGPGTGKTTIIRTIADILSEMQMEFALTAPTGRAAKRMTEATGFEAKTLHRLLEYVPGEGFHRNEEDPLYFDVIIADEASMIDVPLLYALLKAIPEGTRLIMVGDADQLPSVGPGDVLRDVIRSETVPVMRLTEIFRQAEKSRIVTNAHRINAGRMPLLTDDPDSDFLFEEITNPDVLLRRVLTLAAGTDAAFPSCEPLTDIQVLVPMKRGPLGVNNLNRCLQETLNPPAPDKPEYPFGDTVFRVGDKIMQIQNDYKIEWTKRGMRGTLIEGTGAFNGDLGTVYRIDRDARRISVLFDDDRLAHYEFTQAEELSLAYCISVHKSQGSEFPMVILPLFSGPPMLFTRNLLYTAVTRAKRRVMAVGRRDTLAAMVANNRTTLRYTALCQRLKEWKELLQR